MSLRVYVAGASSEVHLVRGYIDRLRVAGITISHDWTKDVLEKGPDVTALSPETRMELAIADFDAIDTSDLVWLVTPTPPNLTVNAWTELGYAQHSKATVIVSGPGAKACIFVDLTERYASHDDAFARVVAAQREVPWRSKR